jgi:hypothetical protein
MGNNLIRGIVAGILQVGERLLDDSVASSELLEFIQKTILELNKLLEHRPDAFHAEMIPELARVTEAADELGLRVPKFRGSTEGSFADERSAEKTHIWRDSLPDGSVLTKQGLVHQTGEMLLRLLAVEDSSNNAFIRGSLERLLRQVEVRRKACLQPHPPLSWSETWIEKHDIAYLFCVHARNSRDFRFLNGAMKLNDWGYRAHRRNVSVEQTLSLVRAVLEQELILAEFWG